MLTKVLYNVDALFMLHLQRDIGFRFGTPEQIMKAVNFDVCKKHSKLIGYHSNVPCTTANLCQFNDLHTRLLTLKI